MKRLVDERIFAPTVDPEEAAQTYVALLLGEAQLRQALGTMPPLKELEIEYRSRRAFELSCRLFGGSYPDGRAIAGKKPR